MNISTFNFCTRPLKHFPLSGFWSRILHLKLLWCQSTALCDPIYTFVALTIFFRFGQGHFGKTNTVRAPARSQIGVSEQPWGVSFSGIFAPNTQWGISVVVETTKAAVGRLRYVLYPPGSHWFLFSLLQKHLLSSFKQEIHLVSRAFFNESCIILTVQWTQDLWFPGGLLVPPFCSAERNAWAPFFGSSCIVKTKQQPVLMKHPSAVVCRVSQACSHFLFHFCIFLRFFWGQRVVEEWSRLHVGFAETRSVRGVGEMSESEVLVWRGKWSMKQVPSFC